MRVLVTGAQGCIGAWVVKLLVEKGADVLVYDLETDRSRLAMITSPEQAAKVPVEVGRIEDTDRARKIVKEGAITHVVHLAAVLMPYCQTNPVAGGLVNVIGTLNIFEAARDSGRDVRIVYASSTAVLGPDDAYAGRAVSETDPTLPTTHYGVFKQANEGNARVFYTSNGISSIGLRPWTVYGVGRDRGLTSGPTFAMKAAVLGAPYTIRVRGYMDLQYAEDVAAAFLQSLFSNLQGAHLFNLGGEVIEMDDLITLIDQVRPGAAGSLRAEGSQIPVAYRMDDSQLRANVPGIPKTPLAEGVRKTIGLFERLKAEGRLTPDLG